MFYFTIRFLIANLFISGLIVLFLIVRRVFSGFLTGRLQYQLWFLLLGALTVPFIPFRIGRFSQTFSGLYGLNNFSALTTESTTRQMTGQTMSGTVCQINDFALSVSQKAPSSISFFLWGIWIIGALVMLALVIKSRIHLHALHQSALPLQSRQVRSLYESCLTLLNIKEKLPIYSTAFLKSPVIAGLFRPRIYLPIHLISDYNAGDMRYMLLHELQHFKHKDALVNYLICLAGILYWFNPLIWYALEEMRCDSEIACDESVLAMLDKDSYTDYGHALIRLAQKVSLAPFPFSVGIGGTGKQLQRRIIYIASYIEKASDNEKTSDNKKASDHEKGDGKRSDKNWKGCAVFILMTVFVIAFSPVLSTYAGNQDRFVWSVTAQNNYDNMDLSGYFDSYEGSFVLYDLENDLYRIYDVDHATLRVSPNSTYKIYDALFGLKEGVITPENSLIAWDHEIYPFEAWNTDQTLPSAMRSSVNWYFQAVDERLGKSVAQDYIHKISYGNENISGGLSDYWLESSLQISPAEQVELLTKFHAGSLDFAPGHIQAVKESIRLSSSPSGTIYGKTGTGRVDDQNINGWFIGFVEASDNTYFFATNIKAKESASKDVGSVSRAPKDADGSAASEITFSVLSDLHIWTP